MYKGKLDTLNVERFARVSRVRFNETRSRCSYAAHDCIADIILFPEYTF